MSDSELATAVHEAGHALVAHLYNIPIRSVTIKKSATLLGNVQPMYSDRDYDPTHCLIVALAGESAERNLLSIKKVTGLQPDHAIARKAYNEMRKRYSIAKRRVPSGRQLIAHTDALIRKHRGAIKTLAQILLAAETLDGRAVHKILQREIR